MPKKMLSLEDLAVIEALRHPAQPATCEEAEKWHAVVTTAVAITERQLTDLGLRPVRSWGAFRLAIMGYAYGIASAIAKELQVSHLQSSACIAVTARLAQAHQDEKARALVKELIACFQREDESFLAALEAGSVDGVDWRSCTPAHGLMTTLASEVLKGPQRRTRQVLKSARLLAQRVWRALASRSTRRVATAAWTAVKPTGLSSFGC